jgi:hypothetical protein
MPSSEQHQELGAFLRARRQALHTPAPGTDAADKLARLAGA